jgi:hypothetical protein
MRGRNGEGVMGERVRTPIGSGLASGLLSVLSVVKIFYHRDTEIAERKERR